MYTYCPNCNSVFRVSAALLAEASGKARCGECRNVFNVFEHLYDELADVRDATAGPRHQQAEAWYATDETTPVDVEVPETDVEPVKIPEIKPAAWQRQPLQRHDLLRLAGVVLLTALLGVQWFWFNRTALAARPEWRDRIEQLCSIVDCHLPLASDPAQLVVISRDVHQHPTASGALVINAVFENRAAFTQRYPVFEVSFTDSNGTPLAMRRFLPAEYLARNVNIAAGIGPGVQVTVALAVVDPGKEAASYRFDFL